MPTLPDLRTSLRLDALASGALGALLLVLAGTLDTALGLPVQLSVIVGALLLAWAGFVAWVAHTGHRGATVEVAVLNAAYVVASVVFALAGWVDLTTLGVGFVLAQALAVGVLLDLQVLGLRQTDPDLTLATAPIGGSRLRPASASASSMIRVALGPTPCRESSSVASAPLSDSNVA